MKLGELTTEEFDKLRKSGMKLPHGLAILKNCKRDAFWIGPAVDAREIQEVDKVHNDPPEWSVLAWVGHPDGEEIPEPQRWQGGDATPPKILVKTAQEVKRQKLSKKRGG